MILDNKIKINPYILYLYVFYLYKYKMYGIIFILLSKNIMNTSILLSNVQNGCICNELN